MIAYLDASVILRLILGQPDQLVEWREVEAGVVSSIAEVECLRTLDLWRDRTRTDLVMATHDVGLARAARAVGLATIGVP